MSLNQNSKKLTKEVNQTIRENLNINTAYDKIQTAYDYESYREYKLPIVHFDTTSAKARRKLIKIRKENQT
jgi:hypothetical protein